MVHHLEGELDHLHPTAGLPMVPLDVVILVVVVETEALVGQVVLEMAAQVLVDQVAAAHTLVDQVGQVVQEVVGLLLVIATVAQSAAAGAVDIVHITRM